LIVADPHVMPYFQDHARNLDHLNDTFDSTITTAEVIAIPASLMISGYARHDSYQVSTAILAGEAYANSAVVDLAVKAISRRKRPSDVPPGGDFHNTFFCRRQVALQGQQFPIGTRGRSVFCGYGGCQPLSQPSLGALGDVRNGHGHQLFPRDHEFAFSVGRISWSGPGLYRYALCGADAAMKGFGHRHKMRIIVCN